MTDRARTAAALMGAGAIDAHPTDCHTDTADDRATASTSDEEEEEGRSSLGLGQRRVSRAVAPSLASANSAGEDCSAQSRPHTPSDVAATSPTIGHISDAVSDAVDGSQGTAGRVNAPLTCEERRASRYRAISWEAKGATGDVSDDADSSEGGPVSRRQRQHSTAATGQHQQPLRCIRHRQQPEATRSMEWGQEGRGREKRGRGGGGVWL